MAQDFARIDRRETRYQFDLELDVPWQTAAAPGLFYPLPLLERLGLPAAALARRPVLFEQVQVCLALATCDAFALLEDDVVTFITRERAAVPESRSLTLLVDEEHKHAVMFRRFAALLRQSRPEAARLFDRHYQRPVTFCEAFAAGFDAGSERDFQYFFWRNTTFFEEYTLYLRDALEAHASGVQPCWLALHACHAREETQHLVTDAAYLEALALPREREEALAKLFRLFLREHFDRYVGRDLVRRLLGELAPELAPVALSFEELPFAADLREARAFRRTRAACASWLGTDRAARGHPHAPFEAYTLVERLEAVVERYPQAGLVFVEDDGAEARVSYGELLDEARSLAGQLAARGIAPGESVVLQCLRPRELLSLFWACLVRGAVPVPLSPPMSLRHGSEELEKLLKVHAALGAPSVVVDDLLHPWVAAALASRADAKVALLRLSDLTSGPARDFVAKRAQPDDVAFVQFSSGSMGMPRGVALSHANLLHDAEGMLAQRGRAPGSDVFVSWMPLSHDMGLIGYHLTPLAAGADQVLASPLSFLRNPLSWLRLISRHRGTVTGAPNIALARVLARLGEREPAELDLSSLHTFLVGAEPIAWPVLTRFMAKLAPAGLRPTAMCPGYGLAEATLAVTMLPLGEVPARTSFARDSLAAPDGVRRVAEDSDDAITLVDVGVPLSGVHVRIVDERGEPRADGVAGTIEVSGRTVMAGYFGEARGESLRDGWLDTGDLGVLLDGRLYVTGRKKDVFFVAGKNYFAHDVEAAVRSLPGVLPGYVALVVDWDARFGVDGLVLLIACQSADSEEMRGTLAGVHEHVRRRFGLTLSEVVVIGKRDFVRTTSGKLQRYRLLERYRAGAFASAPSLRAQAPALPAAPEPASDTARAELLALVQRLWSEALGTAVEPHADFRALGGTSIMAAELHGRLECELDRPLDVTVLLEGATPTALVDAILRKPDLRARLQPPAPLPQVHEAADDTGYAIIAAGVRVPSARGLSAFAALLARPDSQVGTPPPRWDLSQAEGAQAPALPVTGAFLEDVESFDAGAFGLSDDEVLRMDPQQRVFLEVARDALGQARLGSARVGVFVGSGDSEYTPILQRDQGLDRHALLGTLANMSAARVSQLFGLSGPALTVNTACSSSLVAVHQACRALAAGDCELALVGGVQVNLTVRAHRYFRAAGLLSRSGVCRPFDEHADGLVPGEGAGAVLLKPLARALADGDPILAVVRGSAINNDGGSLSGTAPNPAGQRELLARAYATARVSPEDVGYVEAHAAGTGVGDAIEADALHTFLARSPRSAPCLVGSVKGHLGHTLAAAGILGLLKALVALDAGVVPPTAGSSEPARRIDFARTQLAPVLGTSVPFPAGRDGLRRAGVSSFGLGGTNAHVVLEQAPPSTPPELAPGRDVFCVAAPAHQLAAQAESDRAFLLAHPQVDLASACAASARRGLPGHTRRALVVSDRDELLRALAAHTSVAEPAPACAGVEARPWAREQNVEGRPWAREQNKVVFVAAGPGAQSVGMGRFLLAHEPVFRAAFARCCAVASAQGLDLERCLSEAQDSELVHRIDVSQPLAFAFSVALAAWLEDLGVLPDLVLGHSAGEYAAAYLASMLSLEDALRLVIARGRAMARARPGGMAALFASEQQVEGLLARAGRAVTIAAVNGPEQTVVSGASAELEQLLALASEQGIELRRLNITCAAHSPLMADARAELAHAVRGVSTQPARRRFISSLTGRAESTLDAEHWPRHLVERVRFAQAIECAVDEGGTLFVELGASGGLSVCIDRILGPRRSQSAVVSMLRGEEPSGADAVTSLGALYEAGVPVRFERRGGRRGSPKAEQLGLLPLLRARHWLPAPAATPGRDAMWLERSCPSVRDHVTAGTATTPLVLLLDRLLAREQRLTGTIPRVLDAVMLRPLAPPEHGVRLLTEVQGDERTLRAHDEQAGSLVSQLTCRVAAPRGRLFASLDLAAIRKRCQRSVSAAQIYTLLAERGFVLGPSMRCIETVQVGEDELLVSLRAPATAERGYVLSPPLLDAAAQATVALGIAEGSSQRDLFLGFSVGRLEVHAPVPDQCLAHVRLASALRPDSEVIRFDVVLCDAEGSVLLELHDFSAKRVSSAGARAATNTATVAASPARTMASPAVVTHVGVEAMLRGELARLLRVDAERIPASALLSRLGVDSLMAVDLLGRVAQTLGVRLSPTLLFEHRTLAALCQAIERQKERG